MYCTNECTVQTWCISQGDDTVSVIGNSYHLIIIGLAGVLYVNIDNILNSGLKKYTDYHKRSLVFNYCNFIKFTNRINIVDDPIQLSYYVNVWPLSKRDGVILIVK